METLKPNILYFGPIGIRGGIGGSARLRNMLNALGKMEANTRLISYLPEYKFKVTHTQPNNYLNTTVISVPISFPKILKLPALLQILIYGLRFIRNRDIVFTHSPGIVYGLPALILAKIFRKPLFIDLTDIKDIDTPQFIYDYVLRNSDMVFTVSRYLEDVAKFAGCRRVVHAPGFIDANIFQKDISERERIRYQLNIGSDEVAIGYAGAFSPDEGLSFLLKAFKNLSARYKNLKLVFIGGRNAPGTDDIPELANELGIKDRVIFVPTLPYESVPGYLSALDIACSPKIDRPMNRAADPIRVYEYMSVGLPVIATAMGETRYAIEDGYDGFLVEPGDEDNLARVLEYVIQNLNSLGELKTKAREKVIGNYTQEVIITKLEINLKRLLSRQGK
ncbi:glycosyltransferase family 4 protein [Chloroflexota bacterium]